MERPEKGLHEETPEMGYEIDQRDRDITGGIAPGLQEIYDDPTVEKDKETPITPEERQRIIDRIKKEEADEQRHKEEVERIIREKNKNKQEKT